MQWLSSGGGSEVALNLDVGDAGTPTITVTNAVGTTSYAHPSYPITLGPAWRHVAIKVALNGTWQDTLSVDGTVLETSSLAAGFSNTGTPATLTLGFPFVRGVGTRSLYLDNVLVESH
jgi:hypothetical protein